MTKFILTFIFLSLLSALFYYPVPMDKIENYLHLESKQSPIDSLFHQEVPQNVVLEINVEKNKKNIF